MNLSIFALIWELALINAVLSVTGVFSAFQLTAFLLVQGASGGPPARSPMNGGRELSTEIAGMTKWVYSKRRFRKPINYSYLWL